MLKTSGITSDAAGKLPYKAYDLCEDLNGCGYECICVSNGFRVGCGVLGRKLFSFSIIIANEHFHGFRQEKNIINFMEINE